MPAAQKRPHNTLSSEALVLQCTRQAGFAKFYTSSVHSDVTLSAPATAEAAAGDAANSSPQTFQCHKLALSSISPVFEAMFQSGMSEAQPSTNTVVIKDVSPEVLQLLLQFIYGLEAAVPFELLVDFYQLADQYQVQEACSMLVDLLINQNKATLIAAPQLSLLVPRAIRFGNSQQLADCLLERAVEKLPDLAKDPAFLATWTLDEVRQVIEHKDAAAKACESVVAAAAWINANSTRLAYWPQLQVSVLKHLDQLTLADLKIIQSKPKVVQLPGLAAALLSSVVKGAHTGRYGCLGCAQCTWYDHDDDDSD